MRIVWRGYGGMTLLFFILAYLCAMGACYFVLGNDHTSYFSNAIIQAVIILLFGLINFIYGVSANNEAISKQKRAGMTKFATHDFFFIPMQYWSFIFTPILLYGVYSIYQTDMKRTLEQTASKNSASLLENRYQNIIENPEAGIAFSLKSYDKSTDNTKKAIATIIEVKGDSVILFIPEERLFNTYDGNDDHTRFKNVKHALYNAPRPALNPEKGTVVRTIKRYIKKAGKHKYNGQTVNMQRDGFTFNKKSKDKWIILSIHEPEQPKFNHGPFPSKLNKGFNCYFSNEGKDLSILSVKSKQNTARFTDYDNQPISLPYQLDQFKTFRIADTLAKKSDFEYIMTSKDKAGKTYTHKIHEFNRKVYLTEVK